MAGAGQMRVGPHFFKRLGAILHRGKCRACFEPRDAHPVRGWVQARPLGVYSKRPPARLR